MNNRTGQPRTRLWIDTDIGDDPDDAVALAVAARHANVDIAGVSTVDGDVEWRAREARALLCDFGCDVPVVAGPPTVDAVTDAHADALLAIGPLTNVAHLVRSKVTLPPRVVIMGGALGVVRHRGVDMRVEHNFGRDPAATVAAVHACECTIVPLDVTARLCIDDTQEAALRATAPSVDTAIARWRAERGVPVCLHDPLALLVLLDEAPVRRERRNISIDEDGAIVSNGVGAVAREVVVDADPQAAIQQLMRLLSVAH